MSSPPSLFITGGTGFIGRTLVRELHRHGYGITLLSRQPRHATTTKIRYLTGDPTVPGPWQQEAAHHDAIINLAGASIFQRWNAATKRQLIESRLQSTANIVQAINHRDARVTVLLNASAVGYYGDGGSRELAEDARQGEDFLAGLAGAWEAAAGKAGDHVRVVLCRLGVVLGPDGGALAKMLPPFCAGLGSALGRGRQYFPWIHLTDLCRIMIFLLENPAVHGPVNCTAPTPVTNRQLTKTLARVLNRPTFLPPIPGLILRLVLGEMAQMVLSGQRAIPEKLLRHDFSFTFPELAPALLDLLR